MLWLSRVHIAHKFCRAETQHLSTAFAFPRPLRTMASESGKGVLFKVTTIRCPELKWKVHAWSQSSTISDAFREEIVAALKQRSRPPKLVGILSTSAKPSRFYADFTKKQCDELGIDFVLKTTGAAASADLTEGEGVEEAIIQSNEDESVDGIMVSAIHPLPGLCLTEWHRCITRSLGHNKWATRASHFRKINHDVRIRIITCNKLCPPFAM
jgi:hypothetical protein